MKVTLEFDLDDDKDNEVYRYLPNLMAYRNGYEEIRMLLRNIDKYGDPLTTDQRAFFDKLHSTIREIIYDNTTTTF
jgi:hypothetical protein